jgi:hypothetical protein
MKMETISINRRGYYIRTRTTGERYLTERILESNQKYRWCGNKRDAAILPTYDIAQKCRARYGGTIVNATFVSVERTIGT